MDSQFECCLPEDYVKILIKIRDKFLRTKSIFLSRLIYFTLTLTVIYIFIRYIFTNEDLFFNINGQTRYKIWWKKLNK